MNHFFTYHFCTIVKWKNPEQNYQSKWETPPIVRYAVK